MFYFFVFLLFMLGASLGSFIGAQVWREDKGIKNKRSICDSCHEPLAWYRLIPLFSSLYGYLAKGSCGFCNIKLPAQYFILEFTSGVFLVLLSNFLIDNNYLGFSFIGNVLLFVQIIIATVVTYFVIRLAYEDYVSNNISARLVYVFLSMSAVLSLISYVASHSYVGFFVSLILVSPLFLVSFLSKEGAMGLGDPLVLSATFLFFGSIHSSAPIAIFFYTVWVATVVSLGYMFYKFGKFERGIKVPFLPFLVIGILVLLITRFYLFGLSDILQVCYFLVG